MADKAKGERVDWYRCPIKREDLSALNKRSDFKGLVQTLGYLGILAITATAALYSSKHWPWPVTVAIVLLHGTCWAFQINAVHELVHDSVFKTRWLNSFFVHVFAFMGWHNHYHFWASHTEHHKFTLHPPDDLEVVLPIKLTLDGYFKSAIVNPLMIRWAVLTLGRQACGILKTDWDRAIFPDSKPEARRRMQNWARFVLAGHLIIIGVSIYMHWWLLPVVTTFAPFYGAWLFYLCNNTQHVGLKDNVPDFRLCCRTIYINPIAQFLYWHMNYHTEHHMFAAVPCYNLGKLHRLIKSDMPECPRGLYATWKQIAAILKRQKEDPTYQYVPELPTPGKMRGETKSVAENRAASPLATAT